jgi:hypothetical protein
MAFFGGKTIFQDLMFGDPLEQQLGRHVAGTAGQWLPRIAHHGCCVLQDGGQPVQTPLYHGRSEPLEAHFQGERFGQFVDLNLGHDPQQHAFHDDENVLDCRLVQRTHLHVVQPA